MADILLGLEKELRRRSLWQSSPPPPHLLLSDKPFCIDTLEFHQWLQFIFIERMKTIVETQALLPQASGIAVMAEEVYKDDLVAMRELLNLLALFDQLIETYHAEL